MRTIPMACPALLLLLAACAPARMYEGAPLPRAEVAVISDSAGDSDVRIVEIDGQLLHHAEVEVLPGTHELLLHLSGTDLEGFELDSFCRLSADVSAPRTYVVQMDIRGDHKIVPGRYGYGHQAWLRVRLFDSESGAVAGRCSCFSDDASARCDEP